LIKGNKCGRLISKYLLLFTAPTPTDPSGTHLSQRCCIHAGCGQRCSANERCIPDDLNCWWRSCPDNGMGWCLPLP
ncbi:hypothetical protein OESDEN_04391, partial [Oesophagostomum dentatum]